MDHGLLIMLNYFVIMGSLVNFVMSCVDQKFSRVLYRSLGRRFGNVWPFSGNALAFCCTFLVMGCNVSELTKYVMGSWEMPEIAAQSGNARIGPAEYYRRTTPPTIPPSEAAPTIFFAFPFPTVQMPRSRLDFVVLSPKDPPGDTELSIEDLAQQVNSEESSDGKAEQCECEPKGSTIMEEGKRSFRKSKLYYTED